MLEINNEDNSKFVYVTLDKNDIVWYSYNNYRAVSTNTGIDDFVESSEFVKSRSKFRIIGNKQNIKLINKLFVKKCLGHIHSIEICSPNIIKDSSKLDPEQLIFILKSIKRNPSIGRWHPLSPFEYPVYLMVEKISNKQAQNNKVIKYLVKFHPAWKEINFMSPININSLINIIYYIIEPRWFINPRKPNSFSKFEQYFGLRSYNVDFVYNTIKETNSNENKRLHDIVNVWYPNLIDDFDYDNNPSCFLYRIFKFYGVSAIGKLKTSRYALKYIILNWLDKINYLNYGKRGLYFVPEHFFYKNEEIQAYIRYIEGGKK